MAAFGEAVSDLERGDALAENGAQFGHHITLATKTLLLICVYAREHRIAIDERRQFREAVIVLRLLINNALLVRCEIAHSAAARLIT